MKKELIDEIIEGESETLELKSVIKEPQGLARLICSFANAQGGKIIVGVKEPHEIVGVDENLLRKVYEAANRRLTPSVNSKLSFLELRTMVVGVIEILPSIEIVLADGGAYTRAGTLTQAMAWTQLKSRLPSQADSSTIESLVHAIEKQTKIIEELHEKIEAANSWKSKWKDYLVSGIVGAVIGALVSK